jgi:transposase
LIGELFSLNGKLLEEQYANHLSGFKEWDQRSHAEDWIIFKENISEYISIDETSLSQGELYTVLTNKAGKGKKGTLIAMIKGTKSDSIISISATIYTHYKEILNFFDNRSTNTESFNAKIKAFKSQFRGVRNIPFFLFRVAKIYA